MHLHQARQEAFLLHKLYFYVITLSISFQSWSKASLIDPSRCIIWLQTSFVSVRQASFFLTIFCVLFLLLSCLLQNLVAVLSEKQGFFCFVRFVFVSLITIINFGKCFSCHVSHHVFFLATYCGEGEGEVYTFHINNFGSFLVSTKPFNVQWIKVQNFFRPVTLTICT